ncbi:MAG TPA: hypothetical protein VNC40_16175 [Gaiellaceae bacterium]|nr:hypothetical protein [Gaiellaceae bacterium]
MPWVVVVTTGEDTEMLIAMERDAPVLGDDPDTEEPDGLEGPGEEVEPADPGALDGEPEPDDPEPEEPDDPELTSVIVTVNVACAVLLCESVAVQVTVVMPTGNFVPDDGLQVTGTGPSRRSIALGVNCSSFPSG